MRRSYLILIALCIVGLVHAQGKQEFTPTQMTPLVGKGCVINQIDKSLVDLFGNVSALGNMVDSNTNNYTSFSSLAGIDAAYHQILSVKDADRVFPGNIEAGFVMQSTSEGTNLLTVDVLEMFVVETYLNGEKQESSLNSSTTSGLLDLNLITVSQDGKTKISVRTTKVFDEVRLAITGVNVDAFANLKLFYAYIGENPIHPITKTEYYKRASVHSAAITGIGNAWTTAIWNWPAQKDNLVGAGSEAEGVGFGTLTSLLTEPRVTINAGQEIPAKTEIGFVIETGSVLAINLLNNTVLTTYDDNDNEVESKTIISALGISAISGGRTSVSLITSKPCQQVKIKFGGLNIDVGGTKIFYAFTRSTDLYVRPECDLKISADIAVCSSSSTQLSGVTGIQWSVEEQPAGANASVNSTGLVTGMNVAGNYLIKAQLGECVDFITITNAPISGISYDCNRPIVGKDVEPFTPKGGGCLLCLSPDLDNGAFNVVDDDLTNYIEYTKGLDLLSNTSIYGVKSGQTYTASTAEPRRVGFIMQATDQFLTADLLKFFVIKTYLGDELQESSPIDENDVVGANLIGGKDNQMRFSFVTTKDFDRVTLWTAGVLSLNLSKFRIYYAFQEPANSTCLAQNSSSSCISLLSAQQHGADINYERTGFNGVANVGASMRNLANVLDGNMTTYAFVNKTAGIAATTTLSIKANRVFEHGYKVGFVVEEQTWVGNVDLLRQLKIKTYLKGVATGDETGTPEVLSLDLIGSSGKSLVAVTPVQSFDEIQLDMGGLVDALVELKVYGAFVQLDTDEDGIPDCVDKNPCGEELRVSGVESGCVGDSVKVFITGGKDDMTYVLWDGFKEYAFTNGTAAYIAENAGRFNCTIRENGDDFYRNLLVEVHPLRTEWTGAISTDWNDWDNWTLGVPFKCTDVVIPSGDGLEKKNGIHYPVLKEGLKYFCDGIHFKPGAELVRQDLLDYEQVWVSVNMSLESNHMLSIPLTDTYTGDFFIPGTSTVLGRDLRDPFVEKINGNVSRNKPFTTCKAWKGSWTDFAGAEILNKKLTVGEAIVVRAKKGSIFTDSTQVEMLFGKVDTTYNYYNSAGTINQSKKENIIRETPGMYIFPHEKGQVVMPFNAKLVANAEQMIYVVANPFMSHLNVNKFLSANKNVLKPFVRVHQDYINNPDAEYNSDLIQLDSIDIETSIEPTTSFFVETKEPMTELIIVFNKDMMVLGDYSINQESASPQNRAASREDDNCSKMQVSSLKAYTRGGDGIVESSEKVQKLQVFTITGKLILEKQNVNSPVRIPLSEGVNMIRVQTENETKTFKLIK